MDVLLSSKELRKIIVNRIFNNEVNFYKLCLHCNVKHLSFLNWCRCKTGDSTRYISHEQLIKVMKSLGIDYKVTFILKDETKVDYSPFMDYRKRAMKSSYEKRMQSTWDTFIKEEAEWKETNY